MIQRRRAIGPVVVAILLNVLAACGSAAPGAGPTEAVPESLGHVHGLGSDPADGTVYAATHVGVFDLGEEGAGPAERVADRWQDTMAFTVVGPDHFLASGHPDQREDLPVQLGLIESTDAARTWEPVSLTGEADFHALEAAGDLVFGYDAVSGRLLVTEDLEDWRTLDRVPVADLAADPRDPARVLATTATGVVGYRADGGPATPLAGAPPLVLVDWPVPDLLVGMTGEGTVYRSGDAGRTWHRTAGPAGDLQALDVTASRWLVATDAGLFRSADDGRTWQRLTGT